MIWATATPSLLGLLSHLCALWISHLSTPWLVHTSSLVSSSHTLVHSPIISHVSIATTSHHLSLATLISPRRVCSPISRLLLPLLLHHLRLLILALLLWLLLLRVELLLLLLWNTTLLPWRWTTLISSSHLVSTKFIS